MQPRLRSQTKTADISCVRRYLRLNQNNVEHKVSTADYADVANRESIRKAESRKP
jgi:hypothetical protein